MKLLDILSEQPVVTSTAGTTAAPAGQPPAMGQPAGGLDPKQAAMAAKQKADQKKQVQDQIKQAETNLQNLRKQLASLG